MGSFWKEYPIVGSEWLVVCLISSLIALPVIYFSCSKKENTWKLFGAFLFLTYVIGYFVVLIFFIGVGSNIIKIIGIFPVEYFDLNEYGNFWDKFFLVGYGLWYLFSLVLVCRWGRKKD